jgi:hypothetical protein
LNTRAIPATLLRDVIVVTPSVEPDSAELICASVGGGWMIQRTRRDGSDLIVHVTRVSRFFHSVLRRASRGPALAPLVFSWLSDRGKTATRLHPHDYTSMRTLRTALTAVLADAELFAERIVVVDSKIRTRP